MKEEQVSGHLDYACSGSMPTKKSEPPSISSIRPGPLRQQRTHSLKPLPHISYGLLKDGPLKKKMAELGISTTGSRPLLERRHAEWVTLWNANCDSYRPLSKAELLRQLESWERTQGGRAPSSSNAMGNNIRSKDFDGASWAAKHDSSFKDLIAQARRKAAIRPLSSNAEESTSSQVHQDSSAGTSMIEEQLEQSRLLGVEDVGAASITVGHENDPLDGAIHSHTGKARAEESPISSQ
jgi:E3 ubiquitin-protein ligase RAD18